VSDLSNGMSEEVRAQLLRLKDLTRRTGVLAEPQMLQLRLWPRVVFKDVLDAELTVDIEHRILNYMVRVQKPPKGKDRDLRVEALCVWVAELLGDEWAIVIKTRQKKGGPGKLLVKCERAAPIPGADPAAPVADLAAYEFKDPITEFRRYKLRDQAAAVAEVAEPLPPIKEK
jgi:hypothetical protein